MVSIAPFLCVIFDKCQAHQNGRNIGFNEKEDRKSHGLRYEGLNGVNR